jgi:hypothetical protein
MTWRFGGPRRRCGLASVLLKLKQSPFMTILEAADPAQVAVYCVALS